MITISLCMIVKNEEQVLDRCLNSVKALVDEVIIVDTGSTDNTKAVAAKYTDRIFHFDWIDDFSAARNVSFSYAACDYILWLDADDWLQERDVQKFKRLKETLDPKVDSVCMDYYVAFDTLGQPTSVYKRNRLVKRARNFQWIDPVHESIEVNGEVLLSDIAVCHGRTHAGTGRNLRIYEGLLERGAVLSGRQLFQYATELTTNGNLEKAIAAYQTIIDDPTAYFELKLECCDRMAHCHRELGRKEQELHALLMTFSCDVPRADYVCRIAYYFQENGDYEKAVNWYQLAIKLEKPEKRLLGVNQMAWTWFPHLQLAACYGKLGRLKEAYAHNETALSYAPNDPNLLNNKKLLKAALKNTKTIGKQA
ncbi:glycosyltransferase family 2 protein [Paenibacillus sp. NEAU-GSW1]|uniref:glycosyltransferase family 2 protein n=1 Tax=Paenibacillus sp. NEAU-GSW1 TaxID=2682486 RepID=UPI0012E10052|nr:glycosyltransferase family 2 protein [Paenibacillus sp. NEAU-GSW1]MUT66812.1 glycosyltransferase [Paenibacillus sp. NEAU-GSW1]